MIAKRFLLSLIGVTMLLGVTAPALKVLADSNPNLVPNSSFEQVNPANPSMPDQWTTNSWGQNSATFNYLNTGHTGSHSVQTTVTNYQNGDAKWLYSPISVTAGGQYSYSDWYESNAQTNIWAQYQLSDGTTQYQWLGAASAHTAWTMVQNTLTIPTNATSVIVFHVLNANGSLTLDDVNLSFITPCSVSEANGVYNGGFEQTCPDNPNMPADWNTEVYGSPTANFQYTTNAHSGSRAVQATMQSGSGEIGWQTNWQAAASNQRYNLTFWQTGSIYVYAYVAIQLTNGQLQYISLMSTPATQNTAWSQYSDTFVTPTNTANVQITIATSGIGTFTLDDVYLNTLANQNPVNFNQGVVSLTFDDGDASTYKNGLPVLQRDNLQGTFYLNAGTLNTNGYMTPSNVQQLAASGEEIGSHEYDHVDMVTLNQSQLIYELTHNNSALQTILGSNYQITDFASPYGSYTSGIIDTVMQYYWSHRDTTGQFNTKAGLSLRQIHGVLVTTTTSTAQVEAWVRQAVQQHEWLVLVYHGIGGTPPGGDGSGFVTSTAKFTAQMNYLKQNNISVMPVNNALNTLLPQTQR